jgi:hypothetical protein
VNWCAEVGSEVEDEQYSEILLQNRQMKRVILVDWYGLILRVDCNRTASASVSFDVDDVVAVAEAEIDHGRKIDAVVAEGANLEQESEIGHEERDTNRASIVEWALEGRVKQELVV